MSTLVRRSAIAVAVAAGLATFIGLSRIDAQSATGPAPEPTAGGETPAAAPVQESTTATIEFMTSPATNATVTWGSTRLGTIAPGQPLVITRPRDSGPLDVVVRANGWLPVTTRAHTFSDNKMLVKLTRPSDSHTLLGYRAPIDAGVPQAAATDAPVPSSLFYAPPGAQPAPSAGGAPAPQPSGK